MLVLWLLATLGWWAFAFMPLPSSPPEWLTAAREACFGSMPAGLPEASGFILLALGPASFLIAIGAIWGTEIRASVAHVARGRLGRCVLVAVAVTLLLEGTWVVGKVRAARAAATWTRATSDDGALPPAYPRQATPAPDFALVDEHGAPVSLARFRGRPVVLTFLYAHCETMCPLIVDTLKHAVPGAVPSEVLVVTLDPWRDTPSTLPAMARNWELPENFHVLSAPRVGEVLKVVEAYGVPFERDEKSGEITHPGLVFLIGPDGRLGYTFNNPPPSWIREGLGRLMTSGAPTGPPIGHGHFTALLDTLTGSWWTDGRPA